MGRTSLAPIRKREILEQFYEVLRQEGIERASMIKVANRMGVYPSHVNHYFPTKEQLISELVEFLIERYEKDFSASLYSTAFSACPTCWMPFSASNGPPWWIAGFFTVFTT